MNLNDNILIQTHDVKWVNDMFKDKRLVVDNTFQRNAVWLKKHKVKLIETILTGFPFPEIYLWETDTDPDTGNTSYSIIDGQQRVTSISDYIAGEFNLFANYLDKANRKKYFAGKKFAELSDDEKNTIWKFKISVRLVKSVVPREKIVEMFLRLNSTSMSLNPQELRNAEFNGEFIRLSKKIADDHFWVKHDLFTLNDRRRMTDIQYASSVLMFFRQGIEEDLTQVDYNRIYDLYNEEYEEKYEDFESFTNIMSVIGSIVNKGGKDVKKFLRKKTHLYALSIAIHNLSQKGEISDEGTARYIQFVREFNKAPARLQEIFGEKLAASIEVYKDLSLAGTQKKTNRLKRIQIVRNLLDK